MIRFFLTKRLFCLLSFDIKETYSQFLVLLKCWLFIYFGLSQLQFSPLG